MGRQSYGSPMECMGLVQSPDLGVLGFRTTRLTSGSARCPDRRETDADRRMKTCTGRGTRR